MRKIFPVDELARDERFVRVPDDGALQRSPHGRRRAAADGSASAARPPHARRARRARRRPRR